MEKSNLIGAITSLLFLISAIMVFSFRIIQRPEFGKWLGYFEFALAIPLIYLLIRSPSENRPPLFYIQIACVLIWLIVEFLLDYLLKLDFRQVRWMVITYVVLFFAAAGGLVGLAGSAGKTWSFAAIILFLIMTALAFIQRRVTGM